MKYCLLIIIKTLCFVLLYNLAKAQTKQLNLRASTKKLINYLSKCDTAGIHTLFEDEKRYLNIKDGISRDCKLITTIAKKYGDHVFDSMYLEKGKNDENVFVIKLLDKPDSSLNLKKCELVVFFYPDRFLSFSKKVLNYLVVQTLLKEPEKKLLRPTDF